MGRRAWLFAGSELADQRAAVVMSLVHSAKLHGHDPWVYLKDVLERLPLHPNHRIDELLPHRWTPRGGYAARHGNEAPRAAQGAPTRLPTAHRASTSCQPSGVASWSPRH
jgi:hypothetical protein